MSSFFKGLFSSTKGGFEVKKESYYDSKRPEGILLWPGSF
jgi:hypothetical protein